MGAGSGATHRTSPPESDASRDAAHRLPWVSRLHSVACPRRAAGRRAPPVARVRCAHLTLPRLVVRLAPRNRRDGLLGGGVHPGLGPVPRGQDHLKKRFFCDAHACDELSEHSGRSALGPPAAAGHEAHPQVSRLWLPRVQEVLSWSVERHRLMARARAIRRLEGRRVFPPVMAGLFASHRRARRMVQVQPPSPTRRNAQDEIFGSVSSMRQNSE